MSDILVARETAAPEMVRADHLLPGDAIMRESRPYRIRLVRLVPDDPDRGRDAHVEIEASPVAHEGAALVTQFPNDRPIRVADCDQIPRTGPPRARSVARDLFGAVMAALLLSPTISATYGSFGRACTQAAVQYTGFEDGMCRPGNGARSSLPQALSRRT